MTPSLLWKMKRRGGYEEGFGTRFGLGLALPAKSPKVKRLWIQAVSMGEMLAIEPLLKQLAKDEGKEVFLTVTTSTGYALAKDKFGAYCIGLAYFPLDFWPVSRRVWRAVDPDLAICAETELWPEHLQQARRRGTPAMLVNGRISDRSLKTTKRMAGYFRSQVAAMTRVLAGSEIDRQRFEEIGIEQSRIAVSGNLKIDVEIEGRLDVAARAEVKEELGLEKSFVILGGSTWPGEEEMLLQACRKMRASGDDVRLLIVPRHGERRGAIRRMLEQKAHGLRFHFKSEGLPRGPVEILIADTHGELRQLTQIANLAFIGRSLPPHAGGQTPVECGILEVPMVFGAAMTNFRSISEQLVDYGAAVKVRTAEEAVEVLAQLRGQSEKLREMSAAGTRWHAASKGAVALTIAAIDAELDFADGAILQGKSSSISRSS